MLHYSVSRIFLFEKRPIMNIFQCVPKVIRGGELENY